ncbi:MAG TPA: succinate dehydrogenase assembly factor 2 [Steroidobacteraceae bacterium]|nr:succinate dehydrogenase assembly factor 2 [Steroidobacteraceae bacterium]
MAGPAQDASKLRWRCRRGMRELDVLLERYLKERWPDASPGQRAAFAALLELPDPDLAALLLGQTVTPVASLAEVVADITHSSRRELSTRTPVYEVDSAGDRRPGSDP